MATLSIDYFLDRALKGLRETLGNRARGIDRGFSLAPIEYRPRPRNDDGQPDESGLEHAGEYPRSSLPEDTSDLSLVYALGILGYDFVSEARREVIRASVKEWAEKRHSIAVAAATEAATARATAVAAAAEAAAAGATAVAAAAAAEAAAGETEPAAEAEAAVLEATVAERAATVARIAADAADIAKAEATALDKGTDIYDYQVMLAYLQDYPFDAAALIWILKIDNIPIYSIKPEVSFSRYAYESIVDLLDGSPLIPLAGYLSGTVRLLSGQTVSAILPSVGHIYGAAKNWTQNKTSNPAENTKVSEYFRRFPSIGRSAVERARNFVIYNEIYELVQTLVASLQGGAHLIEVADISIDHSPITRPSSDCYDITISLSEIDSSNWMHMFRFTVDVGDVVPVRISSAIARWRERPRRAP